MPEANGVPIRLVHENGSLTELMATEINLNVDRKISGHSFPFTGGALWGLEFNVPNTMIEIEGIFTDDRTAIGSTAGFAILDFACTKRSIDEGIGVEQFVTSQNMTAILTGAKLGLKDGNGLIHEIPFAASAVGSHTAYYDATNDGQVLINKTQLLALDAETRAERFALTIKQFIDGELSAYFSTALFPSNYEPTYDTAVLKITQKVIGRGGNNVFPHWSGASDDPYEFLPCYFTTFSGGSNGVQKSAGDKVQDMYGILNNSSRHWVNPANMGDYNKGGWINDDAPLTGTALEGTHAIRGFDGVVGDYIVGIQIPYNSMVQATAGSDKYVPRNFFRKIGATTKINEKGSEANNLPASTSFNTDSSYTGMQGAVHKIDITYEAGEAVYGFVLLFAPIDAIL